MNPFGRPITTETLKAMPRYRNRTITQVDRAREAMRLINAEDKNMNALQHALNLKSEYGDGVSTHCLIYNATGDTIEIVVDQKIDWDGYVYKEEPPRSLQNGQWLAFLHVHRTSDTVGSKAARVYRGKNVKGEVKDFMIAWFVPWDNKQNCGYTEVREKDHFPKYWDDIRDGHLVKAGKITRDESDEYCTSTASIGGPTSPEYIAVLQHNFGPLPDIDEL